MMSNQTQNAGDYSILVQAGRDVKLGIKSSPPLIRLVRLEVRDQHERGGLMQRVNVILKNNGDRTAFILKGRISVDASVTIVDCKFPQYSLSRADWTYDVDITGDAAFVGHHYLRPNEVTNFDVLIGRAEGGPTMTIYRCAMEFTFDEGDSLITDDFFLNISGPVVIRGMHTSGITAELWGRCMAENIKKLDAIGFDFRPSIDPASIQHIKKVAPDLF